MDFHRCQRSALVGTHQQHRHQLIAHVGCVGQLEQVAFPLGLVEAQLAPVMNQQGEPRLQGFDLTPTGLAERFHQRRQGGFGCSSQEPQRGLGCGERRSGAWEACHASREFRCRAPCETQPRSGSASGAVRVAALGLLESWDARRGLSLGPDPEWRATMGLLESQSLRRAAWSAPGALSVFRR